MHACMTLHVCYILIRILCKVLFKFYRETLLLAKSPFCRIRHQYMLKCHMRAATGLLVVLAAAIMLPALSVGWTEDDVWAAEMKLDELRDSVIDQVSVRCAQDCGGRTDRTVRTANRH